HFTMLGLLAAAAGAAVGALAQMLLTTWLGEVVAHDRASYQYLAESIRQFPEHPVLAQRMTAAGLARAQWLDLSGGIAVIHHAWKL
ncbi:MAG: class I SAM-dependent methyltransferase, partial [Hyphomicrobium sp.]